MISRRNLGNFCSSGVSPKPEQEQSFRPLTRPGYFLLLAQKSVWIPFGQS
ncbi:hypothetical protein LA76x_1701 [Lysobacter antibioticus]|uniref:Uncharacterized protein n=1 Tax=Lysobacter antibioticus TaxID=84531 RepID=A0A0S2F8R4_LYSAN|nr:hypothetical protein LA76x_1701 [Lysobacter antibioticus]